MAQTLQVSCISRTNCGGPQERIDYIGGSAWRFTEAQAISFIEGTRRVLQKLGRPL
jgi:hypothetical protein